MRIPDVEVSKVFDMQLKLLNPAPVEWSAGFSQFLFSPSQTQCNIEFDKERRQFFISDVGSRNGTFLNGCRLSEVNYTYFYLQGHGITENCILESIYNLEKTTGSKMKGIYFRGISSQWQCGPGGGYFRNFWVGMCRWDPGTLNLYQSVVQLNFATLY